jgi:hypothetical protein
MVSRRLPVGDVPKSPVKTGQELAASAVGRRNYLLLERGKPFGADTIGMRVLRSPAGAAIPLLDNEHCHEIEIIGRHCLDSAARRSQARTTNFHISRVASNIGGEPR